MNIPTLDRSNQDISANNFCPLTMLYGQHEWLEYEPEALVELWGLAENEEQKELITFLIKKFLWINDRKLYDGCKKIAHQIESIWGLDKSNTIISATCDNANPDGSQALIQTIKNRFQNEWKEPNFFNSFLIAAYEIKENSNIVLIDDFIGTGSTIKKRVEYFNSIIGKRELTNITVYVVSLAAMKFSIDLLNALNINYFSVHWLLKGISEELNKPLRINAIKEMEFLESKLQNRIKNRKLPNFGYERSESLFAWSSNNIPNNVFPIFWWSKLKGGINRNTIFHRL